MKRLLMPIAVLLILTALPVNAQATGARYLIITYDSFYNDVLPLARWKHKKGLTTKVVKLTETGTSASQIRTYILNAYNTWTIKPEYILFVGSPNLLPFPQIGNTYSDNYYTNMDGDIYNEILSGRLTVHSSTEAQTVVNKILLYERTPQRADSLWFRKSCLIVNQDNDGSGDDTIYWNDAEIAATRMIANGFVEIDTLSDLYGHTTTTVMARINAGRGYLMYRGSGVNNWYSPFSCNPDAAVNGAKLPIVLSITCRTIGTGSTAATAEKWLLTGTPTSPRGGVGFFATTTAISNGAHLRSAVARGFIEAVFTYGAKEFGQACEAGRVRVYTTYGASNEYYGFTTLGDPEMNLWTATPCSLAVTHSDMLPRCPITFSVTVNKAANGQPVSNAVVCLAGMLDTTLYAVDTTLADGNATFTIEPQIALDTIQVTVTGRNLQPYEGRITVRDPNHAYVIFQKHAVLDTAAGNGNGLPNRGETVQLGVWVVNWADSAGSAVTGVLRTTSGHLAIVDSMVSFGNIPGHDSAYGGDDGVTLQVSAGCPDLHVAPFDLECRDAFDSVWVSHFTATMHAVDLRYGSVIISGGNGNNSLEPGETVALEVSLRNVGSSPIDDLTAKLRCASPLVTTADSLGYYPHIGPDTTTSNTADHFIVTADSATPSGTTVNFELILDEMLYHDTLSFSVIIGKRDYCIWNPDNTPQNGQNLHAILTSLGYNGIIADTFPSDCDRYQNLFVCAGVWPNNHVIDSSSTEAAAIVDYLLNRSGRVYLEGSDVWYYDPRNNSGYDFAPLFGIEATSDGCPDLGPVVGQAGTFTAGMSFAYDGEDVWMDRISPGTIESSLIFEDGDDDFDCGIALDAGQYRTVGTSFELGLLRDTLPPSTRAVVLDSIMRFFGTNPNNSVAATHQFETAPRLALSALPSPFRHQLVISLETSVPLQASLCIFDIAGRRVRRLLDETILAPGARAVAWDGRDDQGRMAAEGIYLVHLATRNQVLTQKIVLLK